MRADYQCYDLQFKNPSGTSRGVMHSRRTWFLRISDDHRFGIGECAVLRGLSRDDRPDFETRLRWTCMHIDWGLDRLLEALVDFPSIQFGLEVAFASINSQSPYELFPSDFTSGSVGIPINGLIWMGDPTFMKQQFHHKISEGFRCIKMKIAALEFEQEYTLLSEFRGEFPEATLDLRVDANGGFSVNQVMGRLEQLQPLGIHSIEQPIATNQHQKLRELCLESPIPIALDEELIGWYTADEKKRFLEDIKPQYIVLKPSLLGGWGQTNQWIEAAEINGIGWWITSALESNIGLNALAQYCHLLKNPSPQGLGTGSLFRNNVSSPLEVVTGALYTNPAKEWSELIDG